jgi:hypothetical protein
MISYGTREIPKNSLTGTSPSPQQRLKVENASTAFWEGREFRLANEFSIASGLTLVYKFIAPVEFVLTLQTLTVDNGSIRMSAVTGGSEGGTFTNITTFGKNRLISTPAYTKQITVLFGGTQTGGTESEVVRLVSNGQGNSSQTIGQSLDTQRALPIGTYYLKLNNFGNITATGVFSLAWEEYVQPINV